MSVLNKDADIAVRWSTAERVAALKRIVPQAALRVVLRKTGRGKSPCRRLPRWFVVWFVIAMALFCRDSYRQVFRWRHRFRQGVTPGRSTLCEARHSVGVAPLRLLGVDSFVADVPDTPENVRAFGRPGSGRSPAAFPQARVLRLCEIGTHVLWKSLIKPHRRGEHPLARDILRCLEDNMRLLWDRNFLSFALVKSAAADRAPRPPLGAREEQPDLRTDPPSARRFVPGQTVSLTASSRARRRRLGGADHRRHL